MTSRPSPVVATGLVGALGGAVASWAKGQSEPPLQSLAEKAFPPPPGGKDLGGADPTDHPENMPPTVGVEKVYAAATGDTLVDDTAVKAQTGVHYAFGIGAGVAYALLVRRWPGAAGGFGLPAGAVLYLATHATTVPAAGLQPTLRQLPASAIAFESSSHLVYGLVLDLSRRLLLLPFTR